MSALATLHAREPRLAWAGTASLALLGICLLGLVVDPRSLAGVPVWAKPAKFAASFVLWFWTMAWLWPALSAPQHAGRTARAAVWLMIGAAGLELAWIAGRAAFGLPSHFAEDRLGQIAYGLMGVGATLLVALAALLGAMILAGGNRAMDPPRRLAAGLGLLLTGAVGGAAGWAISLHGGPWIGGPETPALGPLPFLWSRDGGDLRVAHFIGMHAMQALPLAAALFASRRAVWAAGLGCVVLAGASFAQALAGRPLL
ncbi:MAG: hypothetical protein MUC64_07990 [Rubritepida sp.]|nr:hypothetical protein [Rubritepida sp.]